MSDNDLICTLPARLMLRMLAFQCTADPAGSLIGQSARASHDPAQQLPWTEGTQQELPPARPHPTSRRDPVSTLPARACMQLLQSA